jgi:hypothetical protein
MAENFIVCVGQEAQDFVVIQSIATRSSKFFQAAMSRDWKEALEKRVMLPETEVRVFEGYLQWLYTGDIAVAHGSFHEEVEFYILGDFLHDIKFRNTVLESLIARCHEETLVPSAPLVQFAWDNTPSDSLLRQTILELWSTVSFRKSITWLLEPNLEKPLYPREFVQLHFKHLESSNDLGNVKSSKKSNRKMAADFKLRMPVA